MREARYVSLIPRTTLHSDSEQLLISMLKKLASKITLHQHRYLVLDQGTKRYPKCRICKALLRRSDGSVVKLRPFGVDRISGDAASLDLSRAKKTFPTVARDLEAWVGRLTCSLEWITWMTSRVQTASCSGELAKLLDCRSMLFSPPDLISSEAMEMKLHVPKRCPACKIAKNANFALTISPSKKMQNMR
jgi:hypothetical protein